MARSKERVEHEATGWAAMSPVWTTPSRYIDPRTVRRTAAEVRAVKGENFGGWKNAKDTGWTVVRVRIVRVA